MFYLKIYCFCGANVSQTNGNIECKEMFFSVYLFIYNNYGNNKLQLATFFTFVYALRTVHKQKVSINVKKSVKIIKN
jgi:hypothetical protein